MSSTRKRKRVMTEIHPDRDPLPNQGETTWDRIAQQYRERHRRQFELAKKALNESRAERSEAGGSSA